MALDQSTIVAGPYVAALGVERLVWWGSTAPVGTVFQVYLDRRLAWWGTERQVVLPLTPGRPYLDVGAVGADEGPTDFGATLPAVPGGGSGVALSWQGGTYLAEDIAGFRVYGEPSPGAGVDPARPLATIPAYADGVITDGAGEGGAGEGGAGAAASDYHWASDALGPGTWHWTIVAVDRAGNESTAANLAATVAGPPNPPAADAQGRRLTIGYDPATRVPTLAWLPSPP